MAQQEKLGEPWSWLSQVAGLQMWARRASQRAWLVHASATARTTAARAPRDSWALSSWLHLHHFEARHSGCSMSWCTNESSSARVASRSCFIHRREDASARAFQTDARVERRGATSKAIASAA